MDILQIKEDTGLNDISQIVNSLELILFRLTVASNWPVVYMTENINRLGYRSADFTAGKLLYGSIIHTDDRDRALSELSQAVETGTKSLRREYRIVTCDGETRWVEEQLRLIKDSGGRTVFLQGGLIDITERKQRDSKLEYISFHDALTGLYNRAFFEEEVSRLDLSRYSHVGILVCDVDGLKLINDILGHKEGDKLIITAAGILKKTFRQGDLVARIGGDEFAVILPNMPNDTIEAACTKLRENIKQYNQSSMEIPLSISIGYAISEKQSSESFQELFNMADQNMYSEKMRNKAANQRTAICRLLQLLGDKDFGTGHTIRLQELAVDLTMPRPYREVQNHQQAIDELRRLAGKQFDTQLVEIFANHLLSKKGPHCP